jgi:trehalose synthase
MPKLKEYESIVGKNVLDELCLLADRLKGKVLQNINSTRVGGGVAEILNRMVPLMQDLGVDARWDVMKGEDTFFGVTKKIHNALHGRPETFSKEDWDIFEETGNQNAKEMQVTGDVVFVHDPQPILFVQNKPKSSSRWVWRCHVDVSRPDKNVWAYLKKHIERYDAAIFSAPQFSQPLSVRQFLMSPSIDPLSTKNKHLQDAEIGEVFARFKINRDKPIITQISRFDYLKDPVGVIEAFYIVRKSLDCQLVLAGGTATDDPEASKVLEEVREKAKGDPDIHILAIPPDSDLEINALQRGSDVIVQKSLREGFGLTISEALWKAKPVVASAVGGIPLQIKHKFSGMLCHSVDGCAYAIKQVLNSPKFAKQLGENGREHIHQNFLLTRHLKEYLLIALAMEHTEDIVYL